MAFKSLDELMNALPSEVSNLIPTGKCPGVCAEVFMHWNEVDKRDDENKPTGEKEIQGQAVFSFEIRMKDGGIKVIDTKSLPIMYASGDAVNLTGGKSNVSKLLEPWSGGKKGKEFWDWFGGYKSFKGRQVIVNVIHEESKKSGAVFATIGMVSEREDIDGNMRLMDVSQDYIPYLERNKKFFKPIGDPHNGWLRVYGVVDEEAEVPPVQTISEQKATLVKGGNKKAAASSPTDKDIPF